MDLIGQDINHAVTQLVTAGLSLPMFETSNLQQQLLDIGHLGRKTGHGFYNYSTSRADHGPTIIPASPTKVDIAAGTDLGLLQPLVQRLLDSGHKSVPTEDTHLLQLAGVNLVMHLGAPIPSDVEPTIALDLALDYSLCESLACQRSDSCSELQFKAVQDACLIGGITLLELPNQPGLPVARTLAMLANVAADAVHRQVCTVKDADQAMCFGVNYPKGPLAWADQVGLQWLAITLANLAHHIDQSRYAPCTWIEQLNQSGAKFYDQ
jgi:3-hydroxybutyryl-CoA dehydrogenase